MLGPRWLVEVWHTKTDSTNPMPPLARLRTPSGPTLATNSVRVRVLMCSSCNTLWATSLSIRHVQPRHCTIRSAMTALGGSIKKRGEFSTVFDASLPSAATEVCALLGRSRELRRAENMHRATAGTNAAPSPLRTGSPLSPGSRTHNARCTIAAGQPA